MADTAGPTRLVGIGVFAWQPTHETGADDAAVVYAAVVVVAGGDLELQPASPGVPGS